MAVCAFLTLCLLIDRIRVVYEECHATQHMSQKIWANKTGADATNILRFPVSQWVPGVKLYVHRAYLDLRFQKAVIRIFGLEHKSGTGLEFTCTWTSLDEKTGKLIKHKVKARR